MKKYVLIILAAAFFLEACDLVDGTEVENPNLPLSEALGQPNVATSWVNGLNEQLASTYNNFAPTAELATDNYVNLETFFNQNVDGGTYRDIDDDFDDAQNEIAILREGAEFGLKTVLENDPDAVGTELEAEMHFHKGVANLLAGELFTALPPDGAAATAGPSTFFNTAVQDFQNALSVDSTNVGYRILLARSLYNLGNQSEAVAAAQQAITDDSGDPFVRFVEFDGVNGPSNTLQDAVSDRGNFDDFQPLPRLDFLDPKYESRGDVEKNIPIAKIEEAHLIIAEAQLADGNLIGARQTMKDVVALIGSSRPLEAFDEGAEDRGFEEEAKTNRPNSSSFVVRSDSSELFRSGLVLDRTSSTMVPPISGTSVTDSIIDNALTNDELLTVLYLMRQEIFFGEGRRIFDLGIRWPVSETEALTNDNIQDSDRQATIPGYLSPITDTAPDMDAFTANFDTFEVTINTDYNKVIALQRGNRFGQ